MSKSLITLLDNSILPACTMVAGKFIGLMLVIRFFHIPFSVNDYSNSILNITTLLNKGDVSKVASYSDLIMYIGLSVVFGINLIRTLYLNNKNINPDILLKLRNLNLINLLEGSFELYHRTFIWLVFTVIANILIIINLFISESYAWIAILVTITTITLFVIFFQDIYREFEDIKKHPSKYIWK